MRAKSQPTIVVVGAAGGIGKQVTLQLQRRAHVVVVVQNAAQKDEVSTLADYSVECDLADDESVQTTIASIDAHCASGIDGVVFCAAMQPVGPLELVARGELESLFAINVFGTIQLIQGLLPKLRESRGRIVLFSSMAGRVAAPMIGAYAASKFALEALADVLRRELRLSGISVSLIEPGGVDTPMATAQGRLVEETLSRLDAGLANLYGPLVRGYGAMAKFGLRYVSKPARVAEVAVAAVMGPREPKARYIVGTDARLMIFLARLLPTRWLDALLMRATLGR